MKLLEWEQKADIRSYQSEIGHDDLRYVHVSEVDKLKYDMKFKLWQLDDYTVTAVAAAVIWLQKK